MTTFQAAISSTLNTAFYEDVVAGLSQTRKTLPCKWFYDEKGSHLFEAITKTDEYYLTRVESHMLTEVAKELPVLLPALNTIVEPGSGASIKTRILLSAIDLVRHYVPIDISDKFLYSIALALNKDYPPLQIHPVTADFTALNSVKLPADLPADRLVFFPGSTIGNFSPGAAQRLLQSFHHLAGEQGHLLIGIDGTQVSNKLINAYDDHTGITAQFNLNLLVRANNELGTDFELGHFKHEVRWQPESHRIEMHLLSTCDQTVSLDQHRFHFRAGETIFTESCYKYPQSLFESLASAAGWQLTKAWHDKGNSDFQLLLMQANTA